jgi:nitroreductase
MEFFETIQKRRSVRKYTQTQVPDPVVQKALEAALLAPNSSNVQTWDFYWVKSNEKKKRLVTACLNQSAARTAQHLVVFAADPKNWKRSQKELVEFIESVHAPALVQTYYRKLIPYVYRWGVLNTLGVLKWMISNSIGLFRPISRGPNSRRDLQEVTIKSAALAAENFVLSVVAQGFSTCMMEGFDEPRVKRLLSLSKSARVVMVVSVGEADPTRGTWGPQFRIASEKVLHIV